MSCNIWYLYEYAHDMGNQPLGFFLDTQTLTSYKTFVCFTPQTDVFELKIVQKPKNVKTKNLKIQKSHHESLGMIPLHNSYCYE